MQNLAGLRRQAVGLSILIIMCFIAQNTSATNRLYFSALNNPESWTSGANGDFFVFDGEITRPKANFKPVEVVSKTIPSGSYQVSGLRSWVKTDRYIEGVGCAGRHSIVECRL